ncbi:Uncharacterized conserved protein [Phaffia rhodozyma]|uniref:Uncharacterized conserved protein n=1 Tax=Phaffia rhodozyma TaxID=264483 RepID=A0A0F7SMJ4_PHARH|nr:Uncharacterized conserved protein [Phaffia rhodozyma]
MQSLSRTIRSSVTPRLSPHSFRFTSTHRTPSGAHHGHETHRTHHRPSGGKKAFDALAKTLLFGTFAISVYTLGALYPPDLATFISPRSAPASPHLHSEEGKEHTEEIEVTLKSLPIVKEYAVKEGWYTCRPYATMDPAKIHHSLTAGTLRGPGRLAVPPLVFAKEDESEAVIVLHLGRSLCGHDGIVHGGMVGVVLDEATGRNALLNLPTKIGVTANLNINYRAPTRANQFVVIRTKLQELKGRKVVVSAEMKSLEGELLADATAIYIEPKWAPLLANSGVAELLGKNPKQAKP